MSSHIIKPIDIDGEKHLFADLVAVQVADLAQWKGKLNAACYHALERYTKANRLPATSPTSLHRVARGCALLEFVCNWQPPKKPVCPCCGKPGHKT